MSKTMYPSQRNNQANMSHDNTNDSPLSIVKQFNNPNEKLLGMSQEFQVLKNKKAPVSRYPRINFINPNSSPMNNVLKRKKRQYPGHSQENFNKYSLIDPSDVLKSSKQDRLSDQNLDYEAMKHNPTIRQTNMNIQINKTAKDQSLNPKSALSHIQNYQNRKLKKIQNNFSNSIRQVETQAYHEQMHSEIQQIILQKQGMGMNIKKNMFMSTKATPSFSKWDEVEQMGQTPQMRQLMSTNMVGHTHSSPKNDYNAFLKENHESISALNTMSRKNNNRLIQTGSDILGRNRNAIKVASTEYKFLVSHTSGSQRNSQKPQVQDSLMSRETNVKRYRNQQSKFNNGDAPNTELDRTMQQNNIYTNDATELATPSTQLIYEHLAEAQSAATYNQPKVERLIQIDYVMNNTNERFKYRILDKFSDEQSKKDPYKNKELDLVQKRNAQRNQLTQIMKQHNEQQYVRFKSPPNMPLSPMNESGKIIGTDQARSVRDQSSPAATRQSFANSPAASSPGRKSTKMEDFKMTSHLMRNMDSNDNLQHGEQILSKDKFKNLDEFMEHQDQANKPRISVELRQQAMSTCQYIDGIIQSRKDKVQNNARLLRQMIDGEQSVDCDENEFLDDPLTSNLEKKRRRIINEFEQKIKKQRQMLEEVQKHIDMKIDPDEKARKIMDNLKGKDRDPDVNQAFEELEPDTKRFLADIIHDVMSDTEKNKMLLKLSKQLEYLYQQKQLFDLNMKKKMLKRRSKEDVQNILKRGMKELNMQAVAHKNKEVAQGYKEQFVFEIPLKTPPSRERKLQKMVKKNFRNIVGQKLDIGFMSKIVNMIQQMEIIFDEANIGLFYSKMGNQGNLWKNDYLRINDMDMDFVENTNNLNDVNDLYNTEVQTKQYYVDLKVENPNRLEEGETEKRANLNFMSKLEKAYQTSLPTFVKIKKNQLFLSEVRFTNEMAKGLSEYLQAVKGNHMKITKGFYVDNCMMRDGQLAKILEGFESQGSYLKTFAYSSGELNHLATNVLLRLIPNLREIHINNLTGNQSKPIFNSILQKIIERGSQIQKLKLSNINLCDNEITQNICQIIDERNSLMHLDLQWSRLSPKQLNLIMQTLAERDVQSLKNLNLSYNSLMQPPQDENLNFNMESPELQASREFVDYLCDFLRKNELLNFIDLSGMNFSNDQLLKISETALLYSETLLSIHLSDNGIKFNEEIRDEILDMMGLSSDIFNILNDEDFKTNQRVMKPEFFKKVIRSQLMSLSKHDLSNNARADANIYTNRLLQTKQSKSVTNRMNQHKVQTQGGVGRLESNLVDQFVMTRWINHSELVFNQQPYLDKYFEMEAAEKWRLNDPACGINGGCPIRNKHRYTVIFYEQDLEDPWSHNEGLIEIKDADVVQQIKDTLNISFRYDHEVAPIIVGTVVNGGFKRKLRMVRADYFAMLSIIQSIHTVNSLTQLKAIRRGIMANLIKGQNLTSDDQHIKMLQGWHRNLIVDKCLRNETQDVLSINYPQELKPKPEIEQLQFEKQETSMESPMPKPEDLMPKNRECSTFVYAAYLPPGLHQFILYCPHTHRAFCKDIVVGLSECEPFPEFPEKFKPPVPVKRPTRQNVWRTWRIDNEKNLSMAFVKDMQRPDGGSFIRDEKDLLACNKIIIKHLPMIQIVFQEIISSVPTYYPQIPYQELLQRITDQQLDAEERKLLPRSQIELSFIGATKFDQIKGVGGSLTRGQFIEIIFRLVQQRFPRQKLADNLENFIEIYIKPQFDKSNILPTRNFIRESKILNQLLFDNKQGLTEVFLEYKEIKGFTYVSSTKLLNPLDDDALDGEQLIPEMQRVFYHSKMTNLKDKDEPHVYHYLVYVEFLDFICRVSIELWKKQNQKPTDVHNMTFALLQKIWDWRAANPSKIPERKLKQNEKKEPFPELQPLMDLDEKEDGE